jgi:hypothetical protein
MMLPVTLSAPSPPRTHDPMSVGSKHATGVGVIEIELDGARIRVRGAVDSAALRNGDRAARESMIALPIRHARVARGRRDRHA